MGNAATAAGRWISGHEHQERVFLGHASMISIIRLLLWRAYLRCDMGGEGFALKSPNSAPAASSSISGAGAPVDSCDHRSRARGSKSTTLCVRR
jgi:hypothetical protein